ncbi:DUF1657 domain-containing protein [Halocella sp. SP3-1]|uniref:DUF1657 domain-containing protein n=1 Tax=Halocella sp. SP3-1 TaxID=2382161 RepID=UPI000F754E5D|nr:DUF1657 domain-containing protein [Halocella sp. SP3-1]AZO94596.1 DUF1657 domain-containing protein [Halocella sp. SP3-1]
MTVKSQLEKTVTNAESVLADLKSYSLATDDKNAQQMFKKLASSQQEIMETLNSRLEYIKREEPQYND